MNNKLLELIDQLASYHSLSLEEYEYLIKNRNLEVVKYAKQKAMTVRQQIFGNKVYIRGLIEISNICKNDCLYCGIRCSNKTCQRYRLSQEEILECCEEGYQLGFRTFVLQGGEDTYFSDDVLCHLLKTIKLKYPDCAITLSLGERSKESYIRLFQAGANRYLLRHETADQQHYQKLHPSHMSYENRMKCLYTLKEIGYQTGCGFMVGSPYQDEKMLSKDLKFIEEFHPQMCGIGPFIPHVATPFKDMKAGNVDLTYYLLSLIRLIYPPILLPSTTALGTIDKRGTEKGIQSGANVIMPNLSPLSVRKKYELYNHKKYTGEESAQNKNRLTLIMKEIGYEIVTERGDFKE